MFLYTPIESFTALLTLRHSHIRNGADEYIPRPSPLSFTTDAPFFEPTFNTRSTTGGVLELNANSESHMQFTSITSYTRAAFQLNADISFSPPGVPDLILYTLPGNRPTEVTTQELRLTSPSGGAFDWLVGLYGASIRNVLLNQNGIANYPPPAMPQVVNDFDTTRTDLAGFGTMNYRVGRFTIGGGIRLGTTRNKANVLIEAGGLPNQEASITTRAALPKLSLSYSLRVAVWSTQTSPRARSRARSMSYRPLQFRTSRKRRGAMKLAQREPRWAMSLNTEWRRSMSTTTIIKRRPIYDRRPGLAGQHISAKSSRRATVARRRSGGVAPDSNGASSSLDRALKFAILVPTSGISGDVPWELKPRHTRGSLMSVSAIKSTPPAPLAAAASLKPKKKALPAKVSTVATIAQATPVKQSAPTATTRINVKA